MSLTIENLSGHDCLLIREKDIEKDLPTILNFIIRPFRLNVKY
ncbi:hypothetical protein DESC_760040 [Desulfosarcina cetonica]|nr:hypothetical protein DESC_760040 [Desulfosarcina cetonica]